MQKSIHADGNGAVQFAGEKFGFARQLFQRPHAGIVAGDDGSRRELRFERGDDLGRGAVHALIQRLNGETVVIAIHDQRGQEIRFGMNQTIGRRIGDHLFAEALGGGDAGRQVDRVGRASEHPQGDLRGRAVMGLAEEHAAVVEHAHGVAGLRLCGVGNVGTEDPGMPGVNAAGAFLRYAGFGLCHIDMVSDLIAG